MRGDSSQDGGEICWTDEDPLKPRALVFPTSFRHSGSGLAVAAVACQALEPPPRPIAPAAVNIDPSILRSPPDNVVANSQRLCLSASRTQRGCRTTTLTLSLQMPRYDCHWVVYVQLKCLQLTAAPNRKYHAHSNSMSPNSATSITSPVRPSRPGPRSSSLFG